MYIGGGSKQMKDFITALDPNYQLDKYHIKNNVAVFSHDLNDQLLPAQITHLIKVFKLHLHNPLKVWLCHRQDPGILDMLS